ncbi:hypothetical protein [Haloarchaeobius sp. DFWS5]|uniref:hypothetical protein n=1 Tax=Haloarchaeobius sp. DFWS5 TaxID=3446114 RepID=UPI003EBDF9C4
MDVRTEGRTLHIGDVSVELPAEPAQVRRFGRVVLVRFDSSTEAVDARRNVWAFDGRGDRIWRIDRAVGPNNTYVDVVDRDGELWAYSWCGIDYRVDPETGEHVDSVFTK